MSTIYKKFQFFLNFFSLSQKFFTISPKQILSIDVPFGDREVTTGWIRLVKPRSEFSRPARRATPFCTTTLPECKCVTVGNPRSLRNTRASSICRPICWICGSGKPFPRAAYFWPQSSFQQFLAICKPKSQFYSQF